MHGFRNPFQYSEVPVKLKFLSSSSNAGACPSLYETEDGDIVVQGHQLTDPEALGQLRDVLPGETFVVVPRKLMSYFVNES